MKSLLLRLKLNTAHLFLFFCICCACFSCRSAIDDLIFTDLDEIIEQRDYFVNKKQVRLEEFKESVPPQNNTLKYYQHCHRLYQEYQIFKFDSAFHYAKELNRMAYVINDPGLIAEAKVEFSNILISAGIFNEALDTLQSIKLDNLSNKEIAKYYEVLSRGYFDMETFSQSENYAQLYRQKGMACFDSAIVYLSDKSWQYHALQAQKNLKLGNNDLVIDELNSIITTYNLSNDELASQLLTLAFTYGIMGEQEQELVYMKKAAIADLKGAKKDAVALLFLANKLYELGDVIRASKYINIALEDSRFYGSNFRLWQISNVLPFIKAEHIVTVEKQKRQLWYFLLVVVLLIVIIGISFVIINKQYIKLRKSKKIVEDVNHKLAVSNDELLLANRINEEYVGYYFETSSQIIEKLEKLKQLTVRKLKKKQFTELLLEVENLNIHKEKAQLYHNFDQAFLEIFPEFPSKVNILLDTDKKISLKDDQLLNTELRIIALIRLGIHDADKISKILNNSVNTIYAYKSRMKNRAIDPNNFEKNVMLITRAEHIINNSLYTD